jgi:type IV secretion system protein VirB4
VVDFTSHDVTAVDLTEILDLGTERTAILGYLFHRIEMLIEEKRPTLILIDEAWKVLDDEYFAKKLAEWLVTARKKNVVVVMMTQFPSQIRGSKARSILEALPNQLLFPNGEAASADYDSFRLTDGVAGLRPQPDPRPAAGAVAQPARLDRSQRRSEGPWSLADSARWRSGRPQCLWRRITIMPVGRVRLPCEMAEMPISGLLFKLHNLHYRTQLSRCRNRKKPTPERMLYGNLESEA